MTSRATTREGFIPRAAGVMGCYPRKEALPQKSRKNWREAGTAIRKTPLQQSKKGFCKCRSRLCPAGSLQREHSTRAERT